jgi:PleD family two-component response regulator
MSTTNETGPPREDVADALRRIEQHRTMLAEIVEVQLRTLWELKELLARSGDAALPGTRAAGVDAEIRRTSQAGRLLAVKTEAAKPPVPKVLLVDDDPTTRNIISHFLRKEEFLVIKASGGSDGLARARAERPDLLVVDAAAPGMNGFELLSILRREPETRDVPVLMLSSSDDEDSIVKSLEEGADSIVKPFSPRVLVAKIKKILKDACDHASDHRPL